MKALAIAVFALMTVGVARAEDAFQPMIDTLKKLTDEQPKEPYKDIDLRRELNNIEDAIILDALSKEHNDD